MGKKPTFEQLTKEGRHILTEFESKRVLRQAGIPVVETRLARSEKEAVALSHRLGFPVVLKVASPDVIHKTDSGGVKLGLRNASEVRKAYRDILHSIRKRYPHVSIHGISVQRMAPPATEVIIGSSKDPQFGPVLMFGLGGIFVELLKDVSFRIIPIGKKDAREMIEEIKGYPLLLGLRGRQPVDLSALIEMMVKVSSYIHQHPEIREMELNPVFAYTNRALAVDARIILEQS